MFTVLIQNDYPDAERTDSLKMLKVEFTEISITSLKVTCIMMQNR